MPKKTGIQIEGQKIVRVREMTELELSRMFWTRKPYDRPMAIELDNGLVLFPSQDSEANDYGMIYGKSKDVIFSL